MGSSHFSGLKFWLPHIYLLSIQYKWEQNWKACGTVGASNSAALFSPFGIKKNAKKAKAGKITTYIRTSQAPSAAVMICWRTSTDPSTAGAGSLNRLGSLSAFHIRGLVFQNKDS